MRQAIGIGLAYIGRLLAKIPELWLLTDGSADPGTAYIWVDGETWDDTKAWTD